jgi:hypothetical protein
MLCLLGRGELVVRGCGVVPFLNSGNLVDLILGNKPKYEGIGSTSSATTASPMALSATSATLEGRDVAGVIGWGFSFLRALEIHI